MTRPRSKPLRLNDRGWTGLTGRKTRLAFQRRKKIGPPPAWLVGVLVSVILMGVAGSIWPSVWGG
jgi:hypothetical protein